VLAKNDSTFSIAAHVTIGDFLLTTWVDTQEQCVCCVMEIVNGREMPLQVDWWLQHEGLPPLDVQLQQILNMSSLVELIQQSAITSWIGIADVLGIVFVFHASTVDRKYDCIGMVDAFYIQFCYAGNELEAIPNHHPFSKGCWWSLFQRECGTALLLLKMQ